MRNEDIAGTFDASGRGYESSALELINLGAAELVERLNLTSSDDFVDLGCGAGAVMAQAEPKLTQGSAIGIDLSRVQLELARERFRLSPIQPRFVQEDAAATGLRNRSADAVGLGLVLPYADRPRQLLKEATRLTRLGGRVAATVIGAPFFGVPGTRLLGLLERRGVAWPEVELQFDPREAVRLALLCEVEDRRLDDVTIDAWWRMLKLFGFLPQGRERVIDSIGRDMSEDDRVVDADGKVRCAVRIWLLSATVREGDPWV